MVTDSQFANKEESEMKVMAIAGLALALTACGHTTEKIVYVPETDAPTEATDAPETTKPIVTQPVATWTDEDEFIWDIESSYGTIYIPESDVIEVGYLVCQTLRGGATASDIYIALGNLDDATFATAVTASAVINFCPDQQWKFGSN